MNQVFNQCKNFNTSNCPNYNEVLMKELIKDVYPPISEHNPPSNTRTDLVDVINKNYCNNCNMFNH